MNVLAIVCESRRRCFARPLIGLSERALVAARFLSAPFCVQNVQNTQSAPFSPSASTPNHYRAFTRSAGSEDASNTGFEVAREVNSDDPILAEVMPHVLLGSEYLRNPPDTPRQLPDLSPALCLDLSAFKSLLFKYRKLDDAISTRMNRARAFLTPRCPRNR